MFWVSGKYSSTGEALYDYFYLREEDCILKVVDDFPVNARKPSPADVSYLSLQQWTAQSSNDNSVLLL